jgi:phosphopantothenoylcysteine decarboxylase/phosphopantothenate--cysteine ligase
VTIDRPNHVILAITGSIAAYKAAQLASELVQNGSEVRIILTDGAAHFVAPLTFEAITGNPVVSTVWDQQSGSSRMGHLELAHWTDVLVVAPASANAIARLALGLADDMLGAVALAFRGAMLLAPAMETAMFEHPATQLHLRVMQERGARIIGPESGRLASGAEGKGRMSEPEAILEQIRAIRGAERAHKEQDLAGLAVLITAGPTHEAIDPVRYIGNRSSGKMGYNIAEEARDRGAAVTLVTGPTALTEPNAVHVVHVESAQQMRDVVVERAPDSDVVVMAAAIADFRPAQAAETKIKRESTLQLKLTPTEDVAAVVSQVAPNAFHVGFALETQDLIRGARDKLRRKGQRLVVANALGGDNNPFGSDSNRVAFVTESEVEELPMMSKHEIARRLWDRVARELGR